MAQNAKYKINRDFQIPKMLQTDSLVPRTQVRYSSNLFLCGRKCSEFERVGTIGAKNLQMEIFAFEPAHDFNSVTCKTVFRYSPGWNTGTSTVRRLSSSTSQTPWHLFSLLCRCRSNPQCIFAPLVFYYPSQKIEGHSVRGVHTQRNSAAWQRNRDDRDKDNAYR